jgi:hypothetical protein
MKLTKSDGTLSWLGIALALPLLWVFFMALLFAPWL